MRNYNNEIKIGLFVVISVAIGMFFFLKTVDLQDDTYTLKTYFNYAGGVKVNAMVMLSGIEVGRVTGIRFIYDPETRVEVELSINSEAKIHTDSLAYIGTQGFIGDAYVGLTSGTSTTPFAKNGSTIGSEDPIEVRKLMKKAEGIATKLDETLVDVKKLAKNLNGTVEYNRGKIDDIIVNIEQTSVNFNEFSEDIKKHPWKLLMKGKEK